MKKTAALAALAAIAMATPAAAQGYVGLEYGAHTLDTGGGDQDLDVWQGEGAFGWAGTGWGAQVDGSLGNVSASSGDADFWTLNGHLFWEGGAWRLGGVVAYTSLDEGGSIEEWAYGAEGSYAVGPNTSLFASATLGTVEDSDADLWNIDAGANYYFSPNMRVGGLIGFGNIDGGGGSDVDTMTFGVNGEFQPWTAPVSITLGWNRFSIDDVDIDTDTFQIGARWNFGGGTLQDRNQRTPFDTNTGYLNRFYGIY